jgi:hypothetical protein
MNSDSDISDTEKEIPMYETTNDLADQFRVAVSKWKEEQLDTILGDTQNTVALNTYLKKTKETYEAMKNYIEGIGLADHIDESLRTALGNPSDFSTDTRINILHTISRDLIEFPFTYDTALINSFQPDETLETEIIANK